MLELEKTYLAKNIPSNLKNCEHKEIIDIYIPKESVHPSLRIRKSGNKFEMTKKEPIKEGDASVQREQTIILTEPEFKVFHGQLDGRKVRKIRYNYIYNNLTAEFDVFKDELEGLVLIDFEFSTEKEKELFAMPNFCLADVTQKSFVAGGSISGKSYTDIASKLKEFNYRKLTI
jgi:CYTH domain-containing protein